MHIIIHQTAYPKNQSSQNMQVDGKSTKAIVSIQIIAVSDYRYLRYFLDRFELICNHSFDNIKIRSSHECTDTGKGEIIPLFGSRYYSGY